MSKFRTDRVRQRLDVDAVLDERVQVGLDELLDLIHQINPTGFGIPAAERDRRYARKSRLQSLLIRRFGADLIIRPGRSHAGLPGAPGAPRGRQRRGEPDPFVRIDCKNGRNACHARLDALDEDARAWAVRCLDQGPPDDADAEAGTAHQTAPAPASPDPGETDPGETDPGETDPERLLRLGLAAHKEYDFEAARRHLTAALRASHGAAAPARVLLGLLVDHLAADDEALLLLPGLDAEARADTEVRLHLGLAAARAGHEDLALELTRALLRPQVAPTLLVLARRALARGDLAAAEEHLGGARALCPALPEALEVADELQARRSAERQPHEQEALLLLDREDFARADERARAILRRWPESTAARRVRRAVSERYAERDAQVLLGQAEAAAAQGSREAALSLLSRAVALCPTGPLHGRLTARLGEIEREEHAAAKERKVAGTAALLEHDLESGLRGYLDLPEPLREAVRERVAGPAGAGAGAHLGWMDEICRGRQGASARAMVEAAVALGKARALLPTSPQGALSLLSQHERCLAGVGAARLLVREAEGALLEARRRRAEASLARIITCLTEQPREHHEEARRLLYDLEVQLLSEEDQEAVRRWTETFYVNEQVFRLWARYEDLIRRRSLPEILEGRQALSDVVRFYPPDRRAKYLPHIRRVETTLCAIIGMWIDRSPGPPDELRDFDLSSPGYQGAQAWVLPCGAEVLLANWVAAEAFLRVYCLTERRVVARLVLKTANRFNLQSVTVDAEGAWLLGESGGMIRLVLPEGFCPAHRPAAAAPDAAAEAADGQGAKDDSAQESPAAPAEDPAADGAGEGDSPPTTLGPVENCPDLGLGLRRYLPPEVPAGGDESRRECRYPAAALDPRHVWRPWSDGRSRTDALLHVEVVDTDYRPRRQGLGQCLFAHSVLGGPRQLVLCGKGRGLLRAYTPDGSFVEELAVDPAFLVHGAVAHPCGQGLLLLCTEPTGPRLPQEEEARRKCVRLIAVSAAGEAQPRAPQPIPGTDGAVGLGAAVIAGERLCHLRTRRFYYGPGDDPDTHELLLLRAPPGAGPEARPRPSPNCSRARSWGTRGAWSTPSSTWRRRCPSRSRGPTGALGGRW